MSTGLSFRVGTVSRRSVAAIGCLLFLTVAEVSAAAPAAATEERSAGAATAVAFSSPVEYRSEGGSLFVTMEARPTTIKVGSHDIAGATYNGVYGGPVLGRP